MGTQIPLLKEGLTLFEELIDLFKGERLNEYRNHQRKVKTKVKTIVGRSVA